MSVGDREECVKCGYLETPIVEYQRERTPIPGTQNPLFMIRSPERLKVTCKRCQYSRSEACCDTFSAAEETTP